MWAACGTATCGQQGAASAGMRCNGEVDDFALAGYDLEELLGFGGGGEVWRARERSTGELVALKRLRGAGAAGSIERLRREAALLATVKHDHVVRLRAVVPGPDGLVLVLEFAEGGSLASLLGVRGRLAPGEVVTIGAPLAQALADVHARGLVHGDVTPGNVLFDGFGKPLLADLGVASLAGEGLTPRGATFGYADPAVGAVDGPMGSESAADVHGLAAVCFSALAGVPPYTERDAALAQRLGPLALGVPAALVAAIEAGLDPDPSARPDAATFGRALFAACAPEAVRLVRPSRPVVAEPTHEVAGRLRAAAADVSIAAGTSSGSGRHRWRANRTLVLGRVATAACAVGLLGGAVAGGVVWASHDHRASAGPAAAGGGASGTAAASVASPSGARAIDWRDVLAALDTARATAFVDADVTALARVYVPGSASLASDRDTLGRLVAAGEHARGLRLQLVSVGLVAQSSSQVTLAVRDTLPDYELVRAAGAAELVTGRGERSWTVVLRAEPVRGGWLIGSIEPA
jgi:eukaryotic-like serine/threonine-protein kinase